MDPVGKALWFIESHFAQDITLDAIANASDVTRYHLSRAFGYATGHSIMRYVRARRLTQAARALVDGAPDILAVALEAGATGRTKHSPGHFAISSALRRKRSAARDTWTTSNRWSRS